VPSKLDECASPLRCYRDDANLNVMPRICRQVKVLRGKIRRRPVDEPWYHGGSQVFESLEPLGVELIVLPSEVYMVEIKLRLPWLESGE